MAEEVDRKETKLSSKSNVGGTGRSTAAVGISSKDSTACYVCGERAPTEESHFIRGHWLVCPTCVDSLRPVFQRSSGRDEWPLWLAQADEYLAVGSEMMEAGRYHLAIYFSHQAMEVGVKGLLIQRDLARGKLGTHSIFVLLKTASEIDERFSRFGSKAWRLDTLYYFTRYPFGETTKLPRDFFNDRQEVEEALGGARQVLEDVRLVTKANTTQANKSLQTDR